MELKERVRKSEKLTPEVKKALNKWIAAQPTKQIAAVNLGLSYSNMERVVFCGSCAPATATRIRAVLNLTEPS